MSNSTFWPTWTRNCCQLKWECKPKAVITAIGVALTISRSITFNALELRRRFILFLPNTRLVTLTAASTAGQSAQSTPLNISKIDLKKYKYIVFFSIELQISNKRHVAVYHIGTYEVPDEAACPCKFHTYLCMLYQQLD